MFDLLKLNTDEYIVIENKKLAFFCSSVDNLIRTLRILDVSFEEIETGLTELSRNMHNVANYGVNKTFIFSKKV